MDINEYFCQKKELQNLLLAYIDCESDIETHFNQLINILEKQQIGKVRTELSVFFHLIKEITKNHYQLPDYFTKIEKLFQYFINEIRDFYSSDEIIDMFKRCKKILLILFKLKIITAEEYSQLKSIKYYEYFYPEIKTINNRSIVQIIDEKFQSNPELLDNFEEKRQLGQNDSYLCSLIRSDSIQEFVQYMNKYNISPSSTISPSIFEANDILARNRTTLIEYSAFYSAIQIFQYLKMNNAELTSSLWIYVIHSYNAELIEFLVENNVPPPNGSYETCYKEAIKCHHNNLADYIYDNFLVHNNEDENDKNKVFDEKLGEGLLATIFHYYNFQFFPNKFDEQIVYYYACRYNLLKIVEFTKELNLWPLNEPLKGICFLYYKIKLLIINLNKI